MHRHLPLIAVFALAGCSAQPDAPSPGAPSGAEQPAYGAEYPSQPPADPSPATPVPPPAPPSPAPPAMSGVPQRFQGTFAINEPACGQTGHESRLVLSADNIQFHESGGPIEQANATGNTLHVVARLTGEDETREATYRFELLEAGHQLRDLDHGMVRVRCP